MNAKKFGGFLRFYLMQASIVVDMPPRGEKLISSIVWYKSEIGPPWRPSKLLKMQKTPQNCPLSFKNVLGKCKDDVG